VRLERRFYVLLSIRRFVLNQIGVLWDTPLTFSVGDANPLGVINILLCTVKPMEQKGHFFEIILPSRSFYFQAESGEVMYEWINAIRNASVRLFNELPGLLIRNVSLLDIDRTKSSFGKAATQHIGARDSRCSTTGVW